jgi:hypothetical protein
MADLRTSEVDEKLVPFNMGPWNFIHCYIFKGWAALKESVFFVKNRKKRGGKFNIKINILFTEATHEPLHLDKWSLVE